MEISIYIYIYISPIGNPQTTHDDDDDDDIEFISTKHIYHVIVQQM